MTVDEGRPCGATKMRTLEPYDGSDFERRDKRRVALRGCAILSVPAILLGTLATWAICWQFDVRALWFDVLALVVFAVLVLGMTVVITLAVVWLMVAFYWPRFCIALILALLPTAAFAQSPPARAPLGITRVRWLKINPLTQEKIDLGAKLFFDKRLSRDGTIACATCHDPDKGWADGRKTARGIDGQVGERNVPTVVNSSWQRFQFHDGRAWNLEQQALEPIQNPIEMDLSLDELERRIRASEYADDFRNVFGRDANTTDISFALAAFERTLLAGHSRYDRFVAGNRDALSPQERAGAELFFGKARCNACHSGPSYSDGLFHVAGVAWRDEPHGREVVTGDKSQRGAWKTPTLRDLARTAPYMHDGSMATLEEVIEHYDRGSVPKDGGRVPNLDEELKPMFLTPTEKADLVFFLKDALLSGVYPQRPK